MQEYAVSEAHVKVVKENVQPNTEGESPLVHEDSIVHERCADYRAEVMAYDFELDD